MRRAAAVVALGIFATFFGVLTAAKPLPALAVAGAGLMVLVGVLTMQAVRSRRPLVQHPDAPSVVPFLLFCYVFPLFLMSRAYSLIGHDPIYLPDVLAVTAAGFALFRAKWRHLGLYALVAGAIGVLMLHAVYVGHEARYPFATKGLVLVVYPLIAVPIAGWVSQRADIERLLSVLPRFIFPLIPVGMVLVHGHHLVPLAYGLEYGCAGSFVVSRGIPGRKLLAVSFIVGAGLLISFSAERGVEITILLSVAAAWIAGLRLYRLSRRSILALCCGALVALFAAAIVDGIIVVPANIPVLSHVAVRASGQQSSASGDVKVRFLIWDYALSTAWNDNPLLGVGAYHPINVVYGTFNVSKKDSVGTHDSYIGYTFYAGYPEGALVVLVFCWGLVRLWRVRRRSPYAPAVFGSLVAVIVTATTNVAFEVTYVGGPSWLILGLAFGLSAKLLDQPDPDPYLAASSELDGQDRDLATHGPATDGPGS
jgi:hypothetical protein